jgi:hypothetical protein
MMVDLSTTNLLLGVMAVVSVFEALALIGAAIGGYMMYRRLTETIARLEAERLTPLAEKVNTILDDVKEVTARVSQQTERVDHAITGTMDRVDETAERVKSTVRDRAARAVGIVKGIRAVIAAVLAGNNGRRHPPETAAGRV